MESRFSPGRRNRLAAAAVVFLAVSASPAIGHAQTSHHVWIDHCDFERAYDGALDITHGSDLVTVSWCRFGGTPGAPHKKVMLIGHSSSAPARLPSGGGGGRRRGVFPDEKRPEPRV